MSSRPVSWVCCNLMVHIFIHKLPIFSNCVLASCSCSSVFWCSPFFFLSFLLFLFFSREDNFPVRLRLLPPCHARSTLPSQRQCSPSVHRWDGQRLVPVLLCVHCTCCNIVCFSWRSFLLRCGHVMSSHVRVSAQTQAARCNSRCISHEATLHCFGLVVCPCGLFWLVGWITIFWPAVICSASIAMLLPSCFWLSLSHFFLVILSFLCLLRQLVFQFSWVTSCFVFSCPSFIWCC